MERPEDERREKAAARAAWHEAARAEAQEFAQIRAVPEPEAGAEVPAEPPRPPLIRRLFDR